MESSGSTRKRRQGPGQPAKPPARLSREKRRQQDGADKNRATKGSSENGGVARSDGVGKSSVDETQSARSFKVGNVGRNGTLYLKPSRITPPEVKSQYAKPPETPPGSPHAKRKPNDAPAVRRETASHDTTTSRYPFKLRGTAFNPTIPVPLPGVAGIQDRGRSRSHSFSTVDEVVRPTALGSPTFQVQLNGFEPRQRAKSSIDLSRGLMDFRIPHYRLGTPRFSDLGTAYLHQSMTSSMATKSITEDMRSSNTSRPDYGRFPAPPGRDLGLGVGTSLRSDTSFLHPSLAGARTPVQTAPRGGGAINVAMYDHVEANINSPSLVRYSPSTGKIMAATPARLIAQITSPWFLDYELLSDFFLTYRNFLSRHDLLNYLLVRLKWALANDSDSGRIVTVRTFVALRHWILNYFADDFIPDPSLRQRLCDLVNEIAHALLQRSDGGGSSRNVVGELKKCWRRICAMFWEVDEDGPVPCPDADIVPGEEDRSSRVRASATSLMQSGNHESMYMDFRRSSVIPLPALTENVKAELAVQEANPDKDQQAIQIANIPTSPASSQSMTVLSCSVPFLKHVAQTKHASTAPRPLDPLKESSEKSVSTAHRHQRSGSFSDALRDDRAPLSSAQQPESIDLRTLPHMSFTGGLVRGLLLQPSPSNVDLTIPVSPPIGNQDFDFGFGTTEAAKSIHDSQQSSAGVKRIVGDVRRALSGRKRDSPASSHRSTSSSESRNSGHSAHIERPISWQRLQGPPRFDMLGERVQSTYGDALQGFAEPDTTQPKTGDLTIHHDIPLDEQGVLPIRHAHRFNTGSHVTTGSRSIVIMDDTWVPGMPASAGASNLSIPRTGAVAPEPISITSQEIFQHRGSSGVNGQQTRSFEAPMHDLLTVPEAWQGGIAISDDTFDDGEARKSSGANPETFDMPPIHHELRKRPGGDLKTANYVRELEYETRPQTTDSESAFSQAIYSSGMVSTDLQNMQYSSDGNKGLGIPMSFLQGRQKDSVTLLPTHSSQPNMRASMKAQVSHLAKLPDANGSDGGIADTLAILEGKIASPTASTHGLVEEESESAGPTTARHSLHQPLQTANAGSVTGGARSPDTDHQGASIFHFSSDTHFGSHASARPKTSGHIAARDAPVMETHLSDDAEEAVTIEGDMQEHAATEEIELSNTQRSFLLDEDEGDTEEDDTRSDISSEMDDDQAIEETSAGGSFYFDDTAKQNKRPTVSFRSPPTPPSTVGAPTSQSAGTNSTHRRTISEPKHSLKEATTASMVMVSNQQRRANQHRSVDARIAIIPASRKETAHLPFVLAFESDVIAEQLTIIEKDALDEIDWKDLIALNWQHAPLHIRNWVDFLKRDDCNGIDIVVSRFNLVVKWVVSECVLTDLPTERARCITKFIHVAAHAHRLRNYATMYQITLALLSSDLARLRKTWTIVPAAERQMLVKLEKLCNPRGNFHHLRAEMESSSVEDACIPFIGLYTHDLMFNAQKPSRLESTLPKAEPLINFERFQTAATLVKSLLTLIEASSKYVFRPQPELLSRCLWLAALEDDEIIARSKILEQ